MALEPKNVDQRTRNIIFGFIREAQELLPSIDDNPYYIIPTVIIFKCIEFYHLIEYFVECGSKMTIEDKLTLISGHTDFTGYGMMKIPSYNNAKTYEWKVKINNIKEKGGLVCIGIIDATNDTKETQFQTESCPLYAIESCKHNGIDLWTKDNGDWYNLDLGAGDILTIILNMKTATISFLINGVDNNNMLSRDVVQAKDLEYRLAVTMRRVETSVTLLYFNKYE